MRNELDNNKDDNSADKNKLVTFWPGKNFIYCGGRLILGPDTKQFILTIILIIIPFIVFEAFMGSYFVIIHTAGIVVIIVPFFALAYIYIALFITASTDPGILPRRNVIFDNLKREDVDQEDPSKNFPPLYQHVYIDGKEEILKFCYSCEIYRPPRCSHCPRCDNCVERFDHHCPWTGTCIGKRNYRPFTHFITSAVLALLICIAVCIFQIIYSCIDLFRQQPFRGSGKNVWKIICTVASLPLIIYCLAALGFVGSLLGFHSYLICTNQTTYETIKRRRGKKDENFSRGICRNICEEYACAPCEPSRIPFRTPLSEYQVTALEAQNAQELSIIPQQQI